MYSIITRAKKFMYKKITLKYTQITKYILKKYLFYS